MAVSTALGLQGASLFLPLLLFGFFFQCTEGAEDCKIGKYDLTDLHAFSPWFSVNDYTNATFSISLCSKLPQDTSDGAHNCPDGTAVCAVLRNGTAVAYGKYTSDPEISEDGTETELMVMFKGEECPMAEGAVYSTIFHFRCGKTMGYPRYLGDLGCSVNFEWDSYKFCSDLPTPQKEVPCTLVKNGSLIDLSPLTKISGGHLVDEYQNRKIFINVCRDIIKGKETSDGSEHCPEGSASCRVIGDEGKSFGQALKKMEPMDDGVKLEYVSSEVPPGCPGKPSTTVLFRCPQRGGSRDPVLLSDFLVSCDLEIEWVTEYACPVEHVVSNTCQLTMEQHDVAIDLSPLKAAQFSRDVYRVNNTDGRDKYTYYINVCDSLGTQCGNQSVPGLSSVCQRKDSDSLFARSCGQNRFMQLRYADRKLTMIMRNGDKCHTNFRRSTMIEFYCNKTAENDGHGYPEFVRHENCSYFFEWGTKYACFDQVQDGTCRVNVGGKRFDLSALVRETGENWDVLSGEDESDDLVVNICHDVLLSGKANSCPPGSAVCAVGKNGAVSLGKYTDPLSYDAASKSLKLTYTNGAHTENNCARKTTINFFCSPGDLESAPVLVHKSEDSCYYELEWHTSAACVLSHQTGDKCRVVDNDAGYVFDLTPLTVREKGNSYMTSSLGHNYLLNVCAAVKDDNYCKDAPHDNAAICQVERSASHGQVKIGEPASKLEYFDGVLNLTYTNGEPYNNPGKTARMAEIAFLCDMAAGTGRPEFLEEKNFTYAFKWRTSYACPTPPLECVVTDDDSQQQFDLSSLARVSENWSVMRGHGPDDRQKFYINICRPVAPVKGVQCGRFAAVCATSVDQHGNEKLFHGSLGKAESPPEIERSISGVKLTYTNGDNCEDGGVKKKFKTSIHFVCAHGRMSEGPISPQQVSPCEYSILWQTSAACAVDDMKNDTACMVRDPNSDFMFNLKPLSKLGGYDVKSADGSEAYKINICGSLPESVCAKFDGKHPTSVCQIGTDKNIPRAAFTSDLEYTSQGELTITYPGGVDQYTGTQRNYIINFFCDRAAQDPRMSYESHDQISTVFRVETALACASKPVDCVVQDREGRQYDLTPLARSTGNWVVIDTRSTHKDLRYHINVCRPVNPTAEMTCPGGAVGGCQTSTNSQSHGFSLGYVQSQPVVAPDGGAISIRYTGGDKCHKGTEKEAFRSTQITFICASVEGSPTFEGESDTCEYSFVWRTPSACAQHVETGTNCKVIDPLYNFEFDLSPLRKTTNNYKVKGDEYEFLLNVCGPLVNGPGSCSGAHVGACQNGSTLKSPIETGMYNSNPIYDSGQISLVYSDGRSSCHHKYNRTTVIYFLCDHSESGEGGPRYVEEQSDCTYVFEWPTQRACPPHQVTDCTFRIGNDVYDLSRLSRSDGNYERTYSQTTYILNICRSLVHKKGQTCPFESAACMIDDSEKDPKKKFHNIGEVTSRSLNIQHKTLMLKYEHGELCKDGKTQRSTVILFDCDKNSDALGSPDGHFMVDCQDTFTWTSSAACPLSLDPGSKVDASDFGNCTVKNPDTGYEFDLTGLRKSEGYTTYDRNGHEFSLNVCAWLQSTEKCANGTAVCQTDRLGAKASVSTGSANARLQYLDGVLALHYKSGDKCNEQGMTRETFINFVCVPGAGKGVPIFIDKSGDCLYYFDWQTELACETEVSCEVKTDGGFTLDFSPLIMKSGQYNVLPAGAGGHKTAGMIYVNLCRPLNPIFGTLCPPGSGACMVRGAEKPLSLGRIRQAPVYDKYTKEARLIYDHGSPCPSKKAVSLSSVIILKCGHMKFSDPELTDVVDSCRYVFTWETPEACEGKTTQKLHPNCTYYDSEAQVTYDLSPLSDPVPVSSSHGGSYQVLVCGHLQDKGEKGEASCAGSAVCLSGAKDKDGSFGNPEHGMFRKNSFTVDLQFTQGKKCGGSDSSRAMSTIYFKCDRTAGNGRPMVIYDKECEVALRWPTSLVCPPIRKKCVVGSRGSLFDLSFLSQDTGSWNYTDSQGNVYWMNLCQPLHGQPESQGCSPGAAVCMKTKTGMVHTLGKLETQVMFVEKNSGSSNSTVVVGYSEGDAVACQAGRRRRSDLSPKVIIRLTCGQTVGAPVYLEHRVDNAAKCIFEFTWASRLACPTETAPVKADMKDGQILDKRTGRTIDLRPLLNSDKAHTVQVHNKKYLISLSGPVQPDSTSSQLTHWACDSAAVCDITNGQSAARNLGSFKSLTYFLLDERLEVEFTAPEKCPGNQSSSHVTTTIIFNCISDKAQTEPEFLYQAQDCGYIFNWDTSLVCLHAAPSVIKPSAGSGMGSKASGSDSKDSVPKVVVGVTVFLLIALACIVVLVLHKAERRSAITARLRRMASCKKRDDVSHVYSRLGQNDSLANDDGDDDDPFNPFNEPDEEAEIDNSQLPPRVSTYHDDSDEDMLL
ncbi:cation-independent mannose-6-phosphate receptor [Aplysia californica]|uniref:Cation-independent mannose-6-phosphate receptor n=1 Tax=Aplysia californica TaxID=6500 RepID=A0ABM1A4P7_APLCA|nr:cation-independent mannose-6-phosphate receptor [Aplysia californica]